MAEAMLSYYTVRKDGMSIYTAGKPEGSPINPTILQGILKRAKKSIVNSGVNDIISYWGNRQNICLERIE
ncbi:hypothetical protein [Frisingicoccus sp.]|jgi:hypothetical protein|uniref:hypothetical protein n=1 Tax=Frisingicoccus sp. TaxID=1918627 RepID=UPI003AB47ADD